MYEYAVALINQDLLGFYKGMDLNIDLISQAVEIYGSNDKVVFTPGDLSAGLDIDEEPYDVYFSSYGTMSHFTSQQIVKLLSDIAAHSENEALVVLDWLGRYSYEWQDLWSLNTDEEDLMDYRISYIYPPEERDSVDIQSFPLRLLSQKEIMDIVKGAEAISGAEIKVLKLFDRSMLVGRHMDTCDYNRHCTPVREAVNSLLEPNIRTDLSTLVVDYVPRHGFTELNKFFEKFTMSWNTLVKHTIEFLAEYEENNGQAESPVDLYKFYSESLRTAVETMQRLQGQHHRAAACLRPQEARDGASVRGGHGPRTGRNPENNQAALKCRNFPWRIISTGGCVVQWYHNPGFPGPRAALQNTQFQSRIN
jgi:hypothetical protein